VEVGVRSIFGIAIMGPDVTLKRSAMARNVACYGRANPAFQHGVPPLSPFTGTIARNCLKTAPAIASYRKRDHPGCAPFTGCGESYTSRRHRDAARAVEIAGYDRGGDPGRSSRNCAVLVVVDVCLDRWCRYYPRWADPCADTGIPRLAWSDDVTPGAAAASRTSCVPLAGTHPRSSYGRGRRLVYERRGVSLRTSLATGTGWWIARVPTYHLPKLIIRDTERRISRATFRYTRELPESVDRELWRVRTRRGRTHCFSFHQAETELGWVVTAAHADQFAARRIGMGRLASTIRHVRVAVVKPNRRTACLGATVC